MSPVCLEIIRNRRFSTDSMEYYRADVGHIVFRLLLLLLPLVAAVLPAAAAAGAGAAAVLQCMISSSAAATHNTFYNTSVLRLSRLNHSEGLRLSI